MNWSDVGSAEAIPDGKGIKTQLDEVSLLMVRSGEQVFGIGNQCTHQGAALDRGIVKLVGSVRTVTCPAHGSVFRLNDGKVMRPPATKPVPVYDVKVEDGRVLVRPRAET